MHQMRQPELLDPDRITSDDRDNMTMIEHRNRAQQLDEALHVSCEYAVELWKHLDAVRSYLYTSLPSDPRAPGSKPRASAAPTGPDDEEGWQNWIATYSAVTSILAGPHGDSGLGLSEANHAAQLRRTAPNLKLLADTGYAAPADAEMDEAPTPPPAPSPAQSAAQSAAQRSAPTGSESARPLRSIALGLLCALALRGALPRRPRPAG
jgi:hypothetical protein